MKRIALTAAALGAVAIAGIGGTALATGAAAGPAPVRVVPVATSAADTPVPLPSAPAVAAERAGTIARDHVGGGCVDEIEREGAGRLWKVEIDRAAVDHEVWVDATTGAVTRAEQEADDDRDGCRPRPEIHDDRDGHGDD